MGIGSLMSRSSLPCLLCLLATVGPARAGEPVASAPAVDPGVADTLPPPVRWSASGEPADGGYRLSLSRGALDFGVHFEQRVAAARPIDARFDSAAPAGTMLPGALVRAAQRQCRPGAGQQPGRARARLGRAGALREQGRHRMEAGAVAGLPEPGPGLSPRRRRPPDDASSQGLARPLHEAQFLSADFRQPGWVRRRRVAGPSAA